MASASALPKEESTLVRGILAATGTVALLLTATVGLDVLLRPDTFPVRRISLEGEFRHASRDLLGEAVAEAAQGNFYTLDLEAVRRAAESIPWVHRAMVRRQWPDTVRVAIREQQLVARWNADAWVNVEGERADLHGQDGPAGVPRFEGPEGTQDEVLAHYRRLGPLLTPLGLRIARLRLTPRYAWELVLAEEGRVTAAPQPAEPPDGARPAGWARPASAGEAGGATGLELILGREQVEARLTRFVRHYPALAAEAGRIRQVDLRYTNGFAVQWLPPGQKRPSED